MKKIKARFIGKDGSMGLINGMVYNMTIKSGSMNYFDVHIRVDMGEGTDMSCPYSTVIAFLNNWDEIKSL